VYLVVRYTLSAARLIWVVLIWDSGIDEICFEEDLESSGVVA
jgi:hypothetical protein